MRSSSDLQIIGSKVEKSNQIFSIVRYILNVIIKFEGLRNISVHKFIFTVRLFGDLNSKLLRIASIILF